MKDTNYITIFGWMINKLNLSGNELICYAIIYYFSQDKTSVFSGTSIYLSKTLNITKTNTLNLLKRLVRKGLIEKINKIKNGKKYCDYKIIPMTGIETIPMTGIETILMTGIETIPMTGIETIPMTGIETIPHNNNIDNTSIDNKIQLHSFSFAESKTKKKEKKFSTNENLCLFKNSKYSEFHNFEKEFLKSDFQNIDIYYYYNAVADWSSAKGKMQKDWIATVRNFMRSDKEKNKLHLKEDKNMNERHIDVLEYLNL